KDGEIHRVAEEDKRRTAHAFAENSNTEQHGTDYALAQHDHRHDRAFPASGTEQQYGTEQRLPKHPEPETAFLSLPETGNDVMGGQRTGRVCPRVMVFK